MPHMFACGDRGTHGTEASTGYPGFRRKPKLRHDSAPIPKTLARAGPENCRGERPGSTPLDIVRDAKDFLRSSRGASEAPVQTRRRMEALDPIHLPFDEDPRPVRWPPLISGRLAGEGASAPPTRGPLEGAFLTPLHLSSPPRTDPPRHRKSKKDRALSISNIANSAPALDSPLPLPPNAARPLQRGSLGVEDEDSLLHCNIASPVGASGDISVPEMPAEAENTMLMAVLASTPPQLAVDMSIDSFVPPSDAVGAELVLANRFNTFAPAVSTSASGLKMPSCLLQVPEMPNCLMQARSDCDYWDKESHLGDLSNGSQIFDSVEGLEVRCKMGEISAASQIPSSGSFPPMHHAAQSWTRDAGRGDGEVDDTASSAELAAAGAVKGATFQWVRGELIGKGSLGSVWKALNRQTGQLMAVKEVLIDSKEDTDDKFRAALQNEIDLYKDLEHPHIVRYLGNDYLDGRLFIYLEYMPGGSIAQVLSQFGPLDEPLIARYARGLLEGLQYLHSCNPTVLHRDIKGANMLVDLDFCVKLADFGCSKRSDMTTSFTTVGSIPWMAPEVVQQQDGYGRKADVWSLGCAMIEMATAEKPWGKGAFENVMYALRHIAEPGNIPAIPDSLDEEGEEFVRACLNRDPEKRPRAADLRNYSFVHGGMLR